MCERANNVDSIQLKFRSSEVESGVSKYDMRKRQCGR